MAALAVAGAPTWARGRRRALLAGALRMLLAEKDKTLALMDTKLRSELARLMIDVRKRITAMRKTKKGHSR